MPKSKQSGTRDDRPVRSSVRDEYLTWADGSFITHEYYNDYAEEAADMVDAMSEEEIYTKSLQAGLPRVPSIEAKLDMTEVNRLLAAEN